MTLGSQVHSRARRESRRAVSVAALLAGVSLLWTLLSGCREGHRTPTLRQEISSTSSANLAYAVEGLGEVRIVYLEDQEVPEGIAVTLEAQLRDNVTVVDPTRLVWNFGDGAPGDGAPGEGARGEGARGEGARGEGDSAVGTRVTHIYQAEGVYEVSLQFRSAVDEDPEPAHLRLWVESLQEVSSDPALYHVDSEQGDDSRDGRSPANAWRTLARVEEATLEPGDSVLLRRGRRWRERIDFPASGSGKAPITFSAYGSGPRPVLDGAERVVEWTELRVNVWTAALAERPLQVFFDGQRGTRVELTSLVDAELDWSWFDGRLFVFSEGDPDVVARHDGVEVSVRRDLLREGSADHVRVRGLRFSKSLGDGVALFQVFDWVIEDCQADRSWRYGFYGNHVDNLELLSNTSTDNFYGASFDFVDLLVVRRNRFFRNHFRSNGDGLAVNSCDDCVIEENLIYENDNGGSADGIQVVNCYAFRIGYNSIRGHSNGDVVLTQASFGDIYYNLLGGFPSSARGIVLDLGYGPTNVFNNTIHGPKIYGIRVRRMLPSGTAHVFNNIVYCERGAALDLREDVDPSLLAVDRNCYLNAKGAIVRWGATHYARTAFDLYQDEMGQDQGSLLTDPRLRDPLANAFALDEDSPCRGRGLPHGKDRDHAGHPVAATPDLGALSFVVKSEGPDGGDEPDGGEAPEGGGGPEVETPPEDGGGVVEIPFDIIVRPPPHSQGFEVRPAAAGSGTLELKSEAGSNAAASNASGSLSLPR